MPTWRQVVKVGGASLLTAVLGCRSADSVSAGGSGSSGTAQAATAPAPEAPAPGQGQQLLRTGAIQLGPGTSKNLWGWQGDGKDGF
jgi:hypothetical protein